VRHLPTTIDVAEFQWHGRTYTGLHLYSQHVDQDIAISISVYLVKISAPEPEDTICNYLYCLFYGEPESNTSLGWRNFTHREYRNHIRIFTLPRPWCPNGLQFSSIWPQQTRARWCTKVQGIADPNDNLEGFDWHIEQKNYGDDTPSYVANDFLPTDQKLVAVRWAAMFIRNVPASHEKPLKYELGLRYHYRPTDDGHISDEDPAIRAKYLLDPRTTEAGIGQPVPLQPPSTFSQANTFSALLLLSISLLIQPPGSLFDRAAGFRLWRLAPFLGALEALGVLAVTFWLAARSGSIRGACRAVLIYRHPNYVLIADKTAAEIVRDERVANPRYVGRLISLATVVTTFISALKLCFVEGTPETTLVGMLFLFSWGVIEVVQAVASNIPWLSSTTTKKNIEERTIASLNVLLSVTIHYFPNQMGGDATRLDLVYQTIILALNGVIFRVAFPRIQQTSSWVLANKRPTPLSERRREMIMLCVQLATLPALVPLFLLTMLVPVLRRKGVSRRKRQLLCVYVMDLMYLFLWVLVGVLLITCHEEVFTRKPSWFEWLP